ALDRASGDVERFPISYVGREFANAEKARVRTSPNVCIEKRLERLAKLPVGRIPGPDQRFQVRHQANATSRSRIMSTTAPSRFVTEREWKRPHYGPECRSQRRLEGQMSRHVQLGGILSPPPRLPPVRLLPRRTMRAQCGRCCPGPNRSPLPDPAAAWSLCKGVHLGRVRCTRSGPRRKALAGHASKDPPPSGGG